MSIKAHLLKLNDFGMPAVGTGSEAIYTNLIYLIMLEPGKFQSHPTMGVGIKSRYRYNNEENFLQNLQMDITNQINAFLPEISMVDVTLNTKDHILGILIDTEDGVYALSYDDTKGLVEASASYMLNDL